MSIYFDCPALHCLVLHACRGGTQKYQIYHYTIDSEQIHKYLDLCKLPIESERITALDTFDGVNENICLVSSCLVISGRRLGGDARTHKHPLTGI